MENLFNGKLKVENDKRDTGKNNFQFSTVNSQLPKGWEVKKLGEVCVISAGNSAPQKKEFFTNGNLPFIRTSDVGKIRKGKIDSSVDYLNEEGTKKLRLFRKGTILFPKSGASTFLNHRVIMDIDGYVSSHLATIKPFDTLEDRFVWYYLILIDAKDLMQDIAYPSLKLSDIKEIPIPLPPLPEQKRIVKFLDKAFDLIENGKLKIENNLKNTKELFESYLNGIFENGKLKVENGEWEEKTLGEVCEFVRGPFGGSLKKAIFKSSGFAVYEQQHAIYNQFHEIRYFIDEKKFIEMRRFELNSGDLIMSCSGTMGKVAIVPKGIEKGIINQALLKLSPKNKLHVEYLKIWMESNDFQTQIAKYSKGAAIKNVVSVKILKEIELPIPRMTEQKQIVKKLDALQAETKGLEKIYQQKIADAEELKKSILQKAFMGQLTVESGE